MEEAKQYELERSVGKRLLGFLSNRMAASLIRDELTQSRDIRIRVKPRCEGLQREAEALLSLNNSEGIFTSDIYEGVLNDLDNFASKLHKQMDEEARHLAGFIRLLSEVEAAREPN